MWEIFRIQAIKIEYHVQVKNKKEFSALKRNYFFISYCEFYSFDFFKLDMRLAAYIPIHGIVVSSVRKRKIYCKADKLIFH